MYHNCKPTFSHPCITLPRLRLLKHNIIHLCPQKGTLMEWALAYFSLLRKMSDVLVPFSKCLHSSLGTSVTKSVSPPCSERRSFVRSQQVESPADQHFLKGSVCRQVLFYAQSVGVFFGDCLLQKL